MSGIGRQSCDKCRAAYESANVVRPYAKVKHKKKVEPPCATCKPDLLPDNIQVMSIYNRCGDEWLTDGWGGRVALSTPAVESTMRIMDIPAETRLALLDQIKLISRTIIKEINAAKEKDAQTKS